MKLTDQFTLRGDLELWLYRHDRLTDYLPGQNLIVNASRVMLANLIAGDGNGDYITDVGVGLDGTSPTPNDTGLTAPYWQKLASHTFPQPGQVAFEFVLPKSAANGMAIREFGLRTHDGQLFARKTRGVIEKDSDMSIKGTWTITI